MAITRWERMKLKRSRDNAQGVALSRTAHLIGAHFDNRCFDGACFEERGHACRFALNERGYKFFAAAGNLDRRPPAVAE